jgi:hypothetical protein
MFFRSPRHAESLIRSAGSSAPGRPRLGRRTEAEIVSGPKRLNEQLSCTSTAPHLRLPEGCEC